MEKGLGRAVLHARAHGIGDLLPELRRACLRPLAYDPQCEYDRGRWLWTVVEAAGARDTLRSTILRALARTRDNYTGVQLCQLVSSYAAAGDPEARVALWRAFSRTVKGYTLAEEEILRIEGAEGYLKMLRLLAPQLPDDDVKWTVEGVLGCADDLLGKDEAQRLLHSETGLSGIRAIWRGFNVQIRRPANTQLSWAQVQAEVAAGADSMALFNRLRAKDQEDASSALAFALTTPDDKIRLTVLRRLAWNTSVPPGYDARLWAVTRSKNRLLRYQSVRLMGRMSHDDVRVRALRSLESPRSFFDRGVYLIRANYRDEDAPKLLSVVARARTRGERHVATDVVRIGDDEVLPSLRSVYVSAYELSPCESCRGSLAEKLKKLGPLPEWIEAENALNSENLGD